MKKKYQKAIEELNELHDYIGANRALVEFAQDYQYGDTFSFCGIEYVNAKEINTIKKEKYNKNISFSISILIPVELKQ